MGWDGSREEFLEEGECELVPKEVAEFGWVVGEGSPGERNTSEKFQR